MIQLCSVISTHRRIKERLRLINNLCGYYSENNGFDEEYYFYIRDKYSNSLPCSCYIELDSYDDQDSDVINISVNFTCIKDNIDLLDLLGIADDKNKIKNLSFIYNNDMVLSTIAENICDFSKVKTTTFTFDINDQYFNKNDFDSLIDFEVECLKELNKVSTIWIFN